MKVKAQTKYVRASDRKVRFVAELIKGKPVKEAATILSYLPHYGARLLYKVLKSAVANAKHNYKLSDDNLFVSQVMIDRATPYKRFHPRAKGSAFPILKRQSHITIYVDSRTEGRGKVKEKEEVSGTKSSS
jgi:large subunit ribosomal protein L22